MISFGVQLKLFTTIDFSSCSSKMGQPLTMGFAFHLLCIILLQCNSAFAMHTVVLAGDSTVLYCYGSDINWRRYHQLGDDTDYKDVFTDNTIMEKYGTFRVDTNENSTNLIIENVTTDLTGKYVCKDVKMYPYKDIHETQLIVLEKLPECHVNASEFIGPNDCNIPLDEIQLSCSVGYRGNNEPELEWRQHGETIKLLESKCSTESNTLTRCNTTVKPDVDAAFNGSHFICQTTKRASEEQYSCTANITVLYAFSSEESQRTTIYRGDKIFCVANSSQSCSYKWVWYERIGNDISRTIESTDHILIARKTGLHRCEAQCDLRNEACLVYPRFVDVLASEESLGQDSRLQQPLEQEEENCQWTPSDKGLLIMGVLPYVAFVGFGLCYLFKLRKKEADGNQ